MATLQAAITQIQAQVAAISGIRKAPDEPPAQINQFPFAVCFSERGEYETGSPTGNMRGLHDIVIELHVARKDLPRDYRSAMQFAKSIPNAIFSANAARTLTAISTHGEITYEFGQLDWGDTPTLGFRFVIEDVKTQDALT